MSKSRERRLQMIRRSGTTGISVKPDMAKPIGIKGSKYYQVAQSQHWRCPVCQDALFNGEALHTHHWKSVKDGGSDREENLIHLHQACHHHLHQHEGSFEKLKA